MDLSHGRSACKQWEQVDSSLRGYCGSNNESSSREL